jgi:hypothetical protein
LLSGLLECGRCGHTLSPQYGSGYARYVCSREATDYGGKLCVSIAARVVDECVSTLVMQALEPASLEVSLEVAANIEEERRRLDEAWRKRLERAQYEVDRATRQYNAVEPENRLVGRSVERQLEERLAAQRDLEEEHLARLRAAARAPQGSIGHGRQHEQRTVDSGCAREERRRA